MAHRLQTPEAIHCCKQFCEYNNQTLINFMSLTRKCLDRKHLMSKLQHVKLQINNEMVNCSLGQTVKKDHPMLARKSKSKDRTVKAPGERNNTLREPSSCKNKSQFYRLDRSKESKESKDSLMKSTHSYYISHHKSKRSGSAADKHIKSFKSKQLTNVSNIINNTFEMQSIVSTHKKKKSNFSSTIGSKFDIVNLNKSAINHTESKEKGQYLNQLLQRSQCILDQYRIKYQALEKQNKRYKKKYLEAMKKIRHLENRN